MEVIAIFYTFAIGFAIAGYSFFELRKIKKAPRSIKEGRKQRRKLKAKELHKNSNTKNKLITITIIILFILTLYLIKTFS